MKTYILCNSNGDVINTFSSKKEVKNGLNYIIKENNKIYGGGIEDKIKDYDLWSLKYDGRKYYSYHAFCDFSIMNKTTDEFVEYDNYKDCGIVEKHENKDFLYLKSY